MPVVDAVLPAIPLVVPTVLLALLLGVRIVPADVSAVCALLRELRFEDERCRREEVG